MSLFRTHVEEVKGDGFTVEVSEKGFLEGGLHSHVAVVTTSDGGRAEIIADSAAEARHEGVATARQLR